MVHFFLQICVFKTTMYNEVCNERSIAVTLHRLICKKKFWNTRMLRGNWARWIYLIYIVRLLTQNFCSFCEFERRPLALFQDWSNLSMSISDYLDISVLMLVSVCTYSKAVSNAQWQQTLVRVWPHACVCVVYLQRYRTMPLFLVVGIREWILLESLPLARMQHLHRLVSWMLFVPFDFYLTPCTCVFTAGVGKTSIVAQARVQIKWSLYTQSESMIFGTNCLSCYFQMVLLQPHHWHQYPFCSLRYAIQWLRYAI